MNESRDLAPDSSAPQWMPGIEESRSLLVFADDWGRHPSSAQHLIARLLGRYSVGWVDTIGTRPPRIDRATARRGLEKLRSWRSITAPRRSANAPQPTVLSPKMWPWFRHDWDRAINRTLLARQLRSWIGAQQGPVTAVTTLPIVADLVGVLPVSRWVYYSVDDFAVWPGLDAEPLRRMEADLVRRVDVVVAASESLRQRLSIQRRDVALLTHGIDLDLWRRPAGQTLNLDEYDSPRIVFWGLVDRRLDVSFVERLSRELTRGSILLIGPENDPDPRLRKLRAVKRVPAVPPSLLPAIAQQADVLIMPYADLPVTQMMQPLKLLEYLASGRPAVVRELPSVTSWSDCLDCVKSAADFSASVLRRAATGLPPEQRRARERLSAEDWTVKAESFERLVFA